MGTPFKQPEHEELTEILVDELRRGPWTYPYSDTDEYTDARAVIQALLARLGIEAPLLDGAAHRAMGPPPPRVNEVPFFVVENGLGVGKEGGVGA